MLAGTDITPRTHRIDSVISDIYILIKIEDETMPAVLGTPHPATPPRTCLYK